MTHSQPFGNPMSFSAPHPELPVLPVRLLPPRLAVAQLPLCWLLTPSAVAGVTGAALR